MTQQRRRRDPLRLHQPPNGQLRRDPAGRIAGGVAAGLAAWKGYNVTTVRIVFVLIAVVTSGTGVALYMGAWLFLPAASQADNSQTGTDDDVSIAAKSREDALGIALAVGLAVLLTVVLLFEDTWLASWAWPQVFSVAALTLIWRNAPPDEQSSLRRMVEPLEAAAGGPRSGGSRTRFSTARMVLAAILLITGVSLLATDRKEIALLRPLGAVALVIAAIVLLLGPWWLRIGRDLVDERQARVRLEERAEVASRVHDSVLQTLALIQRQAEDPQKVIALARVQERELRDVLFGGAKAADSLASALRDVQQDVEARYGVQVEMVTVGDCPLTDPLAGLVAAVREATVNAAKWSGAGVISLFAEVESGSVQVVVRDRGKGFDPDSVPADRKGVAESIRGRMTRFGGTAAVVSAVGEGTKVTLTMPRSRTQS
jgi:signal transduction histidine kinase